MPGLFTGEWNLFWECHGILRGLWLSAERGARSRMLFHTERVCGSVPVWDKARGQQQRMHYASLMNTGRSHNGRTATHNASASNAGVRGHVWLLTWTPRTKTDKESFESAGGFMYRETTTGSDGGVTGEQDSQHTTLSFPVLPTTGY